jgi:hypothetical protein
MAKNRGQIVHQHDLTRFFDYMCSEFEDILEGAIQIPDPRLRRQLTDAQSIIAKRSPCHPVTNAVHDLHQPPRYGNAKMVRFGIKLPLLLLERLKYLSKAILDQHKLARIVPVLPSKRIEIEQAIDPFLICWRRKDSGSYIEVRGLAIFVTHNQPPLPEKSLRKYLLPESRLHYGDLGLE